MKGYDSYKLSNFEWFDKIPSSWKVGSLNHLVTFIMGQAPHSESYNTEGFGEIFIKTGDFGLLRPKAKWYTTNPLVYASEEDVFMCVVGATSGKVNMGINGTISRSIAALRPKNNINQKFLYYFLSCNYQILNDSAQGSAQGIINKTILSNVKMPIPSLEEQTQIASFLDYKTNLIDTTIEKKKRLIELLKEKRQAVINEAVTKGLNPNVPMKDSGVEWLREIPEHWKIKKLKHVVSCNDDTLNDNTDKDLEINYIEIGNVSIENGIENYTSMKFSESPSRARRIIKENDIILSTVRTYLKAITKVNRQYDNYIASTGFAVLRSKNINSNFLGAIVKSENFIDEIISLSVGVSYPAINSSILLDISIPLPPEDEQLIISDKIDKEFVYFQNLISKIEVAIEKLQTYRQSLILEAVTGKIDVRVWQIN
jgi:type I restriction enzyme S subunit